MNTYPKFITTVIIGFLDNVCMILSFVSARFLYGQIFKENISFEGDYLIGILVLFWIILNILLRSYETLFNKSFEVFVKSTWITLLIFDLILLLISIEIGDFIKSVNFVIIHLALIITIFLTIRFLIYHIIENKRFWTIQNDQKVGICGFGLNAIQLASQLENQFGNNGFVGIIDQKMFEKNIPILSKRYLVNIFLNAKNLNVNLIYFCISPDKLPEIEYLYDLAEKKCIRLKFIPDYSNVFKDHNLVYETFESNLLLGTRNEPLSNLKNRFVKRLLDLIVSSIVFILILWWLIPILGLLIKIESRGPVFFIQKRTGFNGKVFKCFKFRSMRVNPLSDIQMATLGDKRVTKIGNFIRKTSIDELPQFLNVLRGEMSVVGPRPLMENHTKEYRKEIDEFMVRQFVKPGITGPAQISGLRGEVSIEEVRERVKLDIDYLENWDLILDIKIIFYTVITLFKGDKNAY